MYWIAGFLIFALGYIMGAYRQREYIKKQVANSRWDWAR